MLDGLYRPDEKGLPKPVRLTKELDEEIKQRESNLIHTAGQLKSAVAGEGASSEALTIDNEVVSLQAQVEAFMQQHQPHSRAPSQYSVSQRSVGSRRSTTSNTSERRLARAELERKKAEEVFRQQADQTQLGMQQLQQQKEQLQRQKEQDVQELQRQMQQKEQY